MKKGGPSLFHDVHIGIDIISNPTWRLNSRKYPKVRLEWLNRVKYERLIEIRKDTPHLYSFLVCHINVLFGPVLASSCISFLQKPYLLARLFERHPPKKYLRSFEYLPSIDASLLGVAIGARTECGEISSSNRNFNKHIMFCRI